MIRLKRIKIAHLRKLLMKMARIILEKISKKQANPSSKMKIVGTTHHTNFYQDKMLGSLKKN